MSDTVPVNVRHLRTVLGSAPDSEARDALIRSIDPPRCGYPFEGDTTCVLSKGHLCEHLHPVPFGGAA